MAQEGRQRAIWGRLALAVLAAACLAGCGQSEMDRADALMAEGKHAEAIAIWQSMLAEDPGRRVLVTRIATAQARMGRLDLAAATLRQAIDRLPADPELHQNLGLVHLKQKNLDAALAEFERVLALQESYPNTHYYIGLIHEMRGDETTARRLYVEEVNKGACLGAWDRLYGAAPLRRGGEQGGVPGRLGPSLRAEREGRAAPSQQPRHRHGVVGAAGGRRGGLCPSGVPRRPPGAGAELPRSGLDAIEDR